ncbi:DUF4038 domain-containing protein [Sinorhizobium fredii]|uniref:apiosidase-like domain-containing protein n=1 Tax=Rhizobium fredii TaxID=380 RepID=UPI000309DCB5|nr:DUF4038 domain-containing protein [Sinorhizobium fredii]
MITKKEIEPVPYRSAFENDVEGASTRSGRPPRRQGAQRVPKRFALAVCLLFTATFAGQACETPSVNYDGASFPLGVRPGKRHLEDASGRPFFMQGDTAWSLVVQLTREDAERYLRDRKARGFNTILVNLIEHRFATGAPANAYGERPFLRDGDYATPNEAYFEHADWVLEKACELGFLVLLTPSYVGNGGGPEGWYQEMEDSGAESMRDYGRFLGRRYGDYNNLVWVQGGDYNPPDKDLIRALVEGIKENDPDALHTAHGSPGSPALEHWSGEPWLAINNVYTYGPVHSAALSEYGRKEAMPFFLMESAYENEHDASEHRLRMQAYQAVLSGAMGHIFGNNPIWHFDGPGLYPAPVSWQKSLDSRGARSMTLLLKVMSSLKWWLLEPDVANTLLVEGRGSEKARAVAARAGDGSFALVYLPTSRSITLDLSRLAGSGIEARWIDPSSGRSRPAEGSPFEPNRQTLKPAPTNEAGFTDWVLELRSQAMGHNL